MKKKIAVLAGDGIGPEVMQEAIKVLKAVALKFGHEFTMTECLVGGAAYPKYGNHLPAETLKVCQESDAILFGSVGGKAEDQDKPQWKNAEKNALLGLRKEFNLGINLRPAKVYSEVSHVCPLREDLIKEGIDILIVRELTGGIYFGQPRETTVISTGQRAVDTMVYTTPEIARVAHAAFSAAQARRGKLVSVDKANVLDCSRLWRKTVDLVAKEYPDVAYEHMFIDNAAMQLIKKPFYFDVILTANMFGDILSDEAAALPGSLGLMPSASFGDTINMYEPSGGSAPDIAGKNIANPIAQILSGAMLLKYSFGLHKEHDAIQESVERALAEGYQTADIIKQGKAVSTSEMGDIITKFINQI